MCVFPNKENNRDIENYNKDCINNNNNNNYMK